MTENNNDYCNHSDDQRSFTGTWGTPELLLAIDNGYTILRYI